MTPKLRLCAATGHRRGIIIADAMLGMLLLAIAALVLGIALTRGRTAELRLADTRQATRLAEAVLADLQAGQNPPQAGPDETIVVQPAKGGQIGSHRWVEVTATVRGQRRALIGPAPGGPASQPAAQPERP